MNTIEISSKDFFQLYYAFYFGLRQLKDEIFIKYNIPYEENISSLFLDPDGKIELEINGKKYVLVMK